jgi:hypothetical protein
MKMKMASGRARYGFDAPGVMKGLLAAGLSACLLKIVAQKPMTANVLLATSTERTPAHG